MPTSELLAYGNELFMWEVHGQVFCQDKGAMDQEDELLQMRKKAYQIECERMEREEKELEQER